MLNRRPRPPALCHHPGCLRRAGAYLVRGGTVAEWRCGPHAPRHFDGHHRAKALYEFQARDYRVEDLTLDVPPEAVPEDVVDATPWDVGGELARRALERVGREILGDAPDPA